MLTSEQIGQLKKLLLEQESLLRQKMSMAIQQRTSRDTSDLEANNGDDSEQSIADLQESLDTSILTKNTDELQAIEIAKESLENNNYGFCIACQGPIDFKRLLALPTAQRCLPCQEQHERTTWKPSETKL